MAGLRVAVLIPIFNEWESLEILLPELDTALGTRQVKARIVLVDDASTVDTPGNFPSGDFARISAIDVLRLRRNLGHQRAIAVGLVHLAESVGELDAIVVMDGDGEDGPSDVVVLLEALTRSASEQAVFAARTKRLERWTFQLMYRLYRALHLILTGVPVRVGNFSAIRPSALRRLVVVAELWNHYAAAVARSQIPFKTVPIARSRRYAGRSRMRFSALVLHGLSAISVFSDVLGARLLVATTLLMSIAALLLTTVVGLRLFTPMAIPGWASTVTGVLVIVLIQAVLLMLVLSFITLGNRSQANLLPIRDASIFIDTIERRFERND